jgi:uncharacterized glyoxalase superfamily protein PhnB
MEKPMFKEPRPLNRMPWLVPSLTVKDITGASEFYAKAFSFISKGNSLGEDNTPWHAELQYKDQIIILSKEGIPGKTNLSPKKTGMASSMNLYFYCEDVDTIFHQAILAGAEVRNPPVDTQWGDRIAIVSDLDGYYWVIATCKKVTTN